MCFSLHPLRRSTGAFTCKLGLKTGETRQPSSSTSSTGKLKYSLRDTEKRLKRQQEQRTNGGESGRGGGGGGGGGWKERKGKLDGER